ncbi:MAG TPA: hypothetical protein VFW65_34815 [Pseudonocardiaceae bacterium]|nr:hypothetical protein [Pseudonocardiaceae bacterium]
MSVAKADRDTCGFCGEVLPDDDGEWIFVEVLAGSPDNARYVDASFCSRAHAAEWFRQPFPDPGPGPVKRHRASIADRLSVIAIGALVVWMALLALIGLWTVIRWIWHS